MPSEPPKRNEIFLSGKEAHAASLDVGFLERPQGECTILLCSIFEFFELRPFRAGEYCLDDVHNWGNARETPHQRRPRTFGDEANYQANGIRQVELQAAIGIEIWFAMLVPFETPSLRPTARPCESADRTSARVASDSRRCFSNL